MPVVVATVWQVVADVPCGDLDGHDTSAFDARCLLPRQELDGGGLSVSVSA